jgi:hypothetical protein
MDAVAAALKLAFVDPAATATEAGTMSDVLLLASVTVAPTVGAVCASVTVQALEAPGPRLVGLQASVETNTGSNRLMVALPELPL